MNYALTARLGTLLFYWISILALQADIKNPPTLERAPVPESQKVTVNRGEVVEITLNAVTSSSKDVQFIIRDQPTAGKFLDAEPVRKTKMSSTIRYQSDPQAKGTLELIKFAARVEGSSVSPSETLQITILDIKPDIEVQDKINVGNVRYGQEATVKFTVKNVGNGEFNQAMLLPAGWSMPQGAEKLVVAAGKSAEVKLNFSPMQLGTVESPFSFGNGAKAQTILIGKGVAPIDIPSVIHLSWDAKSGKRQAEIVLNNPAPKDVSIATKTSDAGLALPESLEVGAFKDAKLTITLNKSLSESFAGTVTVTAMGMPQVIRVSADPAPGMLKMEGLTDKVLDFGAIEQDAVAAAQKSMKLINAGGLPISIFGFQPESFVIDGFSDGMTIPAGKDVTMTVKLKPNPVGKISNSVDWKWDKNPLNFMIKAEVARDETSPGVVNAPPSLPGKTTAHVDDPLEAADQRTIDLEMDIGRAGMLTPEIKLDPRVPKLIGVYQKASTDTSVTVAWKLPTSGNYDFVLLQRTIRSSKGVLRQVWMPVKDVTYAKVGDEGQATMTGLFPGWINALRVCAKSPEGGYSQPTDPLHFVIPVPEPISWTKYLLIAAAIILFVIWRWWQKKSAPLPRVYRPRIEGETSV